MHTLLDLMGTFTVILLSGMSLLRFLRHQADWRGRRRTQVLVLALPLVSLFVVLVGFHHVIEATCSHPDPVWDHTLDITFLGLVCTVLLGATLLGLLRLLLLKQSMMRKELLVDSALQSYANAFAAQHGIPTVRVRLSLLDQPLAVLYGLHRPTILLSTWMKEHLDERELEAVVAHELGHLAHHDYLVNWLALLLRDAFFFLPTSRTAYRQFRREKELACDDWVVQVTQRPLALASALTKVWLSRVDGSTTGIEQPLAGEPPSVKDRVERLLGWRETTRRARGTRNTASFGGVLSLLLVSTFAFALLFAALLMNC